MDAITQAYTLQYPEDKEQRQFMTDYFSSPYIGDSKCSIITDTRVIEMWDNLLPSTTLKFLELLTSLESSQIGFVRSKLSALIRLKGSRISLRDEFRRVTANWSTSVMRTSDLLQACGEASLYNYLLTPMMLNQFTLDYLYLARNVEWVHGYNEFLDFATKYHLPHVTLNTAFYPNRGDFRAYAYSSSLLVNIIGSLIHSVTIGWQGQGFDHILDSVHPRKQKNIIELRTTLKPFQRLVVLVGDISSFTASFKNLSLVLLHLCCVLEQSSLGNQSIRFELHGRCLELKLYDVFKLYFRVITLVPVSSDQGRVFVSQGAMLGLTGVNSFACCCFSLVFLCLKEFLLKETNVEINVKVGGDDFIVTFTTNDNDPKTSFILETIRHTLQKFIGSLKKFEWVIIDGNSISGNTRLTYCKKPIYLDKQQTGDTCQVEIASNWRLPVMTPLIVIDTLNGEETIEHMNKFITAVLKDIPWTSDRGTFQDLYLRLYELTYDIYPSPFVLTPEISGLLFNDAGKYQITNEAMALVRSKLPHDFYPTHLPDELCPKYAVFISNNLISRRCVMCNDGFIRQVWMTTSETKGLTIFEKYKMKLGSKGEPCSNEDVLEIINLIGQLRKALDDIKDIVIIK